MTQCLVHGEVSTQRLFHHMSVISDGRRHQLVVRPKLNNLTVVKNRNCIGIPDSSQTMSYDHCCDSSTLSEKVVKSCLHYFFRISIESCDAESKMKNLIIQRVLVWALRDIGSLT